MKEKTNVQDAKLSSEGRKWFEMANACVKENKADEAWECYHKAVDVGYVTIESLLSAAMIEKTRGNKAEVLRLLKTLLELYPNAGVPVKLYLDELYEQKKYEEGWKFLLEQDEIFAKESRVYLEIKARFASVLELEKPAKEAFLVLYEKYRSREAAFSLAALSISEKQTERAKKYLEFILKEKPDDDQKSVLYAAAEELQKLCEQ